MGASGEVVTSPDARVNVSSLAPSKDGEPAVWVTEVNANGEFKTEGKLTPGSYLVEALVPGFAVSSQRINFPERKVINLTLTPLNKTQASPVGANVKVEMGRGAGGATLTPPQL